MDPGRKRTVPAGANGAGGAKRPKELETPQFGVGSKSKPCTKFFSTAGCPFGANCHFLHNFPGGYQAVANMTNLGGPPLPSPMGRMLPGVPPGVPDGPPTPSVKTKTRMCNKYNTAEGCRWGSKCHFAHGERELGKPISMDNPMGGPPMGPGPNGHFMPPPMPFPDMVPPSSFGASATAKISVDAALAGGIIGKGGMNTKHISHVTGAKLAIRDNENDPNLKNIELEGTFDQIKHASAMVTDLIVRIGGKAPQQAKNLGGFMLAALEATSRLSCVRTSTKAHVHSERGVTLPTVKVSCANLRLLDGYLWPTTLWWLICLDG